MSDSSYCLGQGHCYRPGHLVQMVGRSINWYNSLLKMPWVNSPPSRSHPLEPLTTFLLRFI